MSERQNNELKEAKGETELFYSHVDHLMGPRKCGGGKVNYCVGNAHDVEVTEEG